MTERLKAAVAAVAMAEAKLNAARQAEEDAKKVLWRAQDELEKARIEADQALPKAWLVTRSRYTGLSRTALVIEKRTGKTITARRPGDDFEFRFRLNVRTERFEKYPKQPSLDTSSQWLEFNEGSGNV